MRVLVVTKIFPNALEPSSGPYNRQQFAALARHCQVEVLATVPWFPPSPAAARLRSIPAREVIDGLDVSHPRTLYLPRWPGVGAPLYAASLVGEALRRRGGVDVVLGSWAHPDGAAAIMLAELLRVPAVVKLHGSDINVVARLPGPRRALRLLLPRAARVVAVSRALADATVELGVARERIDVIENGVDGELFRPRPRGEARAHLGLPDDGKRWLLYVGRLEREKGVLDLLDAFARVARQRDDVSLALVGDGGARAEAQEAVAAAGLEARVRFAGGQPLAEVPWWMAACDALVLPSWNEGTPNVLLEALACGRRVVATRVGGCPEVVSSARLGLLVPARDPAALAEAVAEVVSRDYDPAVIAAEGARGSWEESAARLHDTLRRALDQHGGARGAG